MYNKNIIWKRRTEAVSVVIGAMVIVVQNLMMSIRWTNSGT